MTFIIILNNTFQKKIETEVISQIFIYPRVLSTLLSRRCFELLQTNTNFYQRLPHPLDLTVIPKLYKKIQDKNYFIMLLTLQKREQCGYVSLIVSPG